MPRLTPDFLSTLACLAALVGSAPGSAAPTYVFVPALAGQGAPDTGGGTYASFGFVDVNPLGRVVFSATVSGGNAPGGLFTAARPLALNHRAIALVGGVAPGDPYPFPVTFAEFQGASLSGNQVAFLATFDVAGGAGIYVADVNTGTLTSIATVGGAAPSGGVFQQLRVPSNHCGDVVFAGTAGVTRGIFRSTGGALSTVVLQGDPAPNLGPGTFESFGDPNCSDDVVGFSAIVVFPGSPTSAFFRYSGGAVEYIAEQHAPSPDGAPYDAFSTETPGASFGYLGYTDGAGLFKFPGVASINAVTMARLGQTAPRTAGGTFSAFARSPVLKSTDVGPSLVALAEVSGGSASSGVFEMFRNPISGVVTVSASAVVGDPAPETGGGSYSAFSPPAGAHAFNPYIGESGVIAFAAGVSDGSASSGVFVLPEPGALAMRLAGVALLAILCAGRKH